MCPAHGGPRAALLRKARHDEGRSAGASPVTWRVSAPVAVRRPARSTSTERLTGAGGHRLPGLMEGRVDAGDHDVEPGEDVGLPVEGPVWLDVELGATEQRQAGGAFQLPNAVALCERLLRRHALDVPPWGVVGDGVYR